MCTYDLRVRLDFESSQRHHSKPRKDSETAREPAFLRDRGDQPERGRSVGSRTMDTRFTMF